MADERHADPQFVQQIRDRELPSAAVLRRWMRERFGVRHSASVYPIILDDLYRAVGLTTGASVIVDSSKYPGEAYMALACPSVELYLLHLVRDPRAAAFSRMRPKPVAPGASKRMIRYGPASSSLHWLKDNLLIEGLLRVPLGGRYKCLRYEDFVAGPEEVARDVARWVELDAEAIPFLDERTVELELSHTVLGNPKTDSGRDVP